ncbi:tyrosine-type recombinase/integrase [Rhizobium sp. L43]|uniref:tyrosine-type recombinase/integrase n=1 Tax=Rhizobium sp. L43 TaxID=2035452 RepID=UPI000BE9A897|nr:tyrosine-type recombinase/integrase [Rhizobium sp. L43]PDS76385.1 hypothetical protein CO667_22590 [Rhizobium sp. L43]
MQKIHLTDDIVRSLPFTALGRRVHFADSTVENMRLVVAADRKVFYFVPDQPGISGILRIGGHPETATETAREIAARLKRAVNLSSIVTKPPEQLDAHSLPFAAVVELQAQQLHLRRHNRSADKDAKFLKRYLIDPSVNPWALKPIGMVAATDVLDLIYSMRDRPALARTCLSKVKALFNWAMHPSRRVEFGLPANPVSDITPRMLDLRPRWRDRHFSELEMRAYLAAADRLEKPSQRVFCKALTLTGQRPLDLGMMKWSELNLDKGIWMKPRDRDFLYSNTPEITPLSERTVSLLLSLRCGTSSSVDEYVFGSDFGSRGKLARLRGMVDRRMSDYLQGAAPTRPRGEPWRWHDVRRSVIEILMEAGAPVEIARRAIGSAPDPMTSTTALRSIREALERLALALNEIRQDGERDDEDGPGHSPG